MPANLAGVVRFIHEAEDGVCQVFGRLFPRGEAVNVEDLPDEHRALLAANPTFEVVAARSPDAKAAPPAEPAPAKVFPVPAEG